jgi:integrase/recombinase XerD
MPTFKISLFFKPSLNGLYTVNLRVTNARRSYWYGLSIYCRLDQFADGRMKKNFPDYKETNEVLVAYEQRAAKYIRQTERDGTPFSFEAFRSAIFEHRTQKQTPTVWAWMQDVAMQIERTGKLGTASLYKYTGRLFQLFDRSLLLTELTASKLHAFEAWLRKHRNVNDGSIYLYMRTLRASCNRAIRAGIVDHTFKPFAAYSMAHLTKRKGKRAISREDLERLSRVRTFTTWEALSVDLFLFSFYCRGMNLADIAALRPENIKEGKLEYKRRKTGKVYSIGLSTQALDILRTYAGGVFCFPVYPSLKMTPQAIYNRDQKVRGMINSTLKGLCRRAGLDLPDISFYVARHTYANLHKQAGTPIEVIRELLGHSDIRTSEHYLSDLPGSVLDAADSVIF